MRLFPVLLLIVSLTACNHSVQSNDAVRQGVIDHLAQLKSNPNMGGLNMAGMDIKVTAVQFKGDEADASVSITPKGGDPAAGMLMNYHLQQQGNKWVVVGRQDGGASPHGAIATPDAPSPHGSGVVPGVPNPHGDGVPATGGSAKMPSPEDLPPAKKK